MIKGVLLSNIQDLSQAPYMNRFVHRIHFPDTISIYGPILRAWNIYRSETSAMPLSKETLDAYGAYNWTVVELHFSENPYAAGQGLSSAGAALEEYFPPDYNRRMGLPEQKRLKRTAGWPGDAQVRPNAMIHIPLRPTECFTGEGIRFADGPFLRWVQLLRCPESVTEAEFDDWYIHTHAPEVAAMPHLKRFVSYRRLPGLPGPFYRLSELWFANAADWQQDVLLNPPPLTRPGWSRYGEYPFLEPFREFVSTFILERPTHNMLREKGIYTYSC